MFLLEFSFSGRRTVRASSPDNNGKGLLKSLNGFLILYVNVSWDVCMGHSESKPSTTANGDENVAKRKILMCRAKAMMHARYKSFDKS